MEKAIKRAKQDVLLACHEICKKGYVLGTAGNISVRVLERDMFAITPTSIDYAVLTEEDIVVADIDGNIISSKHKPSIEFSMHTTILKNRLDVNAVVHTHSKFATALSAVRGIEIVPAIDIETVLYLGGNINIAPFAPPGSEELATNVLEGLNTNAGVIMGNHGAIGVGKDIKEAMIASDNIERTAEMYLSILTFGNPKPLPTDYMEVTVKKSAVRRGISISK